MVILPSWVWHSRCDTFDQDVHCDSACGNATTKSRQDRLLKTWFPDDNPRHKEVVFNGEADGLPYFMQDLLTISEATLLDHGTVFPIGYGSGLPPDSIPPDNDFEHPISRSFFSA